MKKVKDAGKGTWDLLTNSANLKKELDGDIEIATQSDEAENIVLKISAHGFGLEGGNLLWLTGSVLGWETFYKAHQAEFDAILDVIKTIKCCKEMVESMIDCEKLLKKIAIALAIIE